MKRTHLRRHEAECHAHLRALEAVVDWPRIATVQQLCRVIAMLRQRPIHVEPHRLPPPLVGLWLASGTTDYLFYAEDAPPVLQEHAVVHELAHLLLGPEELLPDIDPWDTSAAPAPSAPLAPQVILQVLEHSCFDAACEHKAELLASLLEQHWRAARRDDASPSLLPPAQPDLRWLSEQASDVR